MNWKDLDNDSRVWVYQSNRKLTAEEVKEIKLSGNQFIAKWAAHGKALNAAFEVFYNRFLVLFVDEIQAQASGCSIDSSVHFIKQIESHFNLDLFNRMQICFRDEEVIKDLPLNEFRAKLENHEISEETIVFNNLVETKADFMKAWEVPIELSWHKQLI